MVNYLDQRKLEHCAHLAIVGQSATPGNVCHICREPAKLTAEHIPPKSAFNEETRLFRRLAQGKSRATTVRISGGFKRWSLCESCNNALGSRYAQHYVSFIKHLVAAPGMFDGRAVQKHFTVPCDTLLFAKQLAVMILALEPGGFSERHYELRKFVLDKDSTIDLPFRVLAFLVPDRPEAGTIRPYHGRIDTLGGDCGFHGGEISMFPFGFVYAFEIGHGYRLDRFTDISSWFRRGSKADRHAQQVGLFERLTGVDSIACSIGHARDLPQADFI